jgi:hypothetical protein
MDNAYLSLSDNLSLALISSFEVFPLISLSKMTLDKGGLSLARHKSDPCI